MFLCIPKDGAASTIGGKGVGSRRGVCCSGEQVFEVTYYGIPQVLLGDDHVFGAAKQPLGAEDG